MYRTVYNPNEIIGMVGIEFWAERAKEFKETAMSVRAERFAKHNLKKDGCLQFPVALFIMEVDFPNTDFRNVWITGVVIFHACNNIHCPMPEHTKIIYQDGWVFYDTVPDFVLDDYNNRLADGHRIIKEPINENEKK
jgi:hypothetical protein